MPRKRLPIFNKASNLVRISIFVAKIKKPIIPKLTLLKKARKVRRFKLLKHYNHGFLEEYEFSPSSTPLIHYHYKKQLKNRSYKDNLYSMLFLCRCLGRLKAEEGRGREVDYILPMEALPAAIISSNVPHGEYLEPSELTDEEDSVDQRAERFIERFYQVMRLQRQESI